MTTPILRGTCLAVLTLALAACGGSSGDSDGGTPSAILADPTVNTVTEPVTGTPGMTPDGTPGNTPGATPDNATGNTSGNATDETSGSNPDEMSGATDVPDEVVVPGAPAVPEAIVPGEQEATFPSDAATAGYSITVQSLWLVEGFPQDLPDNAHLSLIGGATHNAAVSFWEPGVTPTPGVEDMAESGRIDLFLDQDVTPAIVNGTADSRLEFREFIFSSPRLIADGLPTMKRFDVAMNRNWPRVTLLTMLGPSPDWFVGVDGEPLYVNGAWRESVTLDLPLYDAGTKEGMSPVMGGPDIRPKGTIELIAYDTPTGTYGPTDTPQTLARVTFTRTR